MVKVISLSEKAYAELKKIKGKEESFSDVVLKLIKKKPELMDFFGVWKDDDEIKEIFDEILSERHSRIPRKTAKW